MYKQSLDIIYFIASDISKTEVEKKLESIKEDIQKPHGT